MGKLKPTHKTLLSKILTLLFGAVIGLAGSRLGLNESQTSQLRQAAPLVAEKTTEKLDDILTEREQEKDKELQTEIERNRVLLEEWRKKQMAHDGQ